MAGYIGNKAVGINVTTGDILGDVGVGGDVTVGDDLSLTSDSAVLNVGADNDLKITHNGTNGDFESAGDLTFDVAGNVIIDADGGNIFFNDNDTTFGTIGVIASDVLFIATPDGTGVGLNFDGDSPKINPSNGTGAGTDNVADLGHSGGRFKDLYLSGGAFIGGTGAANKLDDVEEGSFTPTFSSGFNSISYANQKGAYTKIGRLVTIQLLINLSSATGTSAIIEISGLPFNAANANSAYGGFYKSFNNSFNTNDGDVYHKQASNAVIGVYSDGAAARAGNNGNIGTGGEIILVGHYYTA